MCTLFSSNNVVVVFVLLFSFIVTTVSTLYVIMEQQVSSPYYRSDSIGVWQGANIVFCVCILCDVYFGNGMDFVNVFLFTIFVDE